MRDERGKTARTALLWGLAAFAVVQFALAIAIETCWPILRDPDYQQKANRLSQRLNSAERPMSVVMLGSSRTMYGLNGSVVERYLEGALGRPVVVFNFGLPGAGPGTHLINLRRLLADGLRPDLLLIEVLPVCLDKSRGSCCDLLRLTADRLSLDDVRVLRRCGHAMARRYREWCLGLPVPCFLHRFSILNALVPGFLPSYLRSEWSSNSDESSFVPHPTISDARLREAALHRAHEEYAFILQHFHLGGPGPLELRRLLETCSRERVPAAFVLMPEGSRFRGWYPAETVRQVRTCLADLGQEFKAPVIDTRAWIADDGFVDAHHLVVAGASQFSLRLGREVILPMLRRRGPGELGHAP